MTASYGAFDRATLNSLSENLDTGDVADPALRLAFFQYLADYGDAMYTGVKADIASKISAGALSALGIINVKDYGASGSNTTTTGNLASGSKVLVVTSTDTFEEGHGISVAGAGEAGADLVTSITSIVGTNVFLADEASTTVSGATVSHDDTAALQEAFDSGNSKFFIPQGTYITHTTVSIDNDNVTVIEGAGINQTIIRLEGDSTKNILKFSGDRSYLNLSNFNLGHDTAGTGHGILFQDDTSNILIEMVKVSSCFHGFYSEGTGYLQKYVKCRADYCDVGFYVNGQVSGGSTGSGTTILFDQCYTSNSDTGYRTNYEQEAVFINCASDHITDYAIESTNCKITHIMDFHTEVNTIENNKAVIRVFGEFAEIVNIDGVLSGLSTAASVAYVVLIETPALNCHAVVKGITGSENTNISLIRVVEETDGEGTFLYYNNNKDGYTFASPSLALENGKFYELYQGTQTTVGATGAASALPTNPLGYMKLKINGVSCVVPYYNA